MPTDPPKRLMPRAAMGRIWLAGFLSAPVLACAMIVASVAFWPDLPLLNTFTHILDSLVVHLSVLAVLGAAMLASIGAPRIVTLLTVGLVIAGLAVTGLRHMRGTLPLAAGTADLQVLWFNMLHENPTPPDRLADALIASPADVIILSEAEAVHSALPRLDAAFAQRAGCNAPNACRMVVLSRRPDARIAMSGLGPSTAYRMAHLDLPAADASALPVTVLGLHMNKPWFFGIVEHELFDATARIIGLSGPVVLVGDFNAAPWSRRLRHFTGPCGFEAPRLPPPTWPTSAGWAGVPIDHVLWRGARLVSLEPWGRDLGSNHVGLLAGIAIDETAARRPVMESCVPGP